MLQIKIARNVIGLAACATALIFPSASPAQSTDNRSALIITIGEYANREIPRLEGVNHDFKSARRIALEMGIPEKKIIQLRDSEATKDNILATIKKIGSTVGPGGRAFIYFSGHGTRYFSQEQNGCVEGLLSYDQQAITNDEFAKASQSVFETADKVITMIDACHSEGVAPPRRRTRSIDKTTETNELVLTPKLFLTKSGVENEQCQRASNHRSRSLFSSSTAIGALKENMVQITSSRPDEVSFDEPGKGGLATQAIRDCLLGSARDLNFSGSVSLDEVQSCAQETINQKLKNVPGVLPHHVTVSGNRNLIITSTATSQRPTPTSVAAATMPGRPGTETSPQTPPIAPIAPTTNPQPAAVASIATLTDIHEQRNPRRKVEVKLQRETLKIGADDIDFSIETNHDGHVYVVLLGSDAKSFYLLFPNGLDGDNRITAKKPMRLPRSNWAIKAGGPAGINQLLVLVTDTPRDLTRVKMSSPTASEPFTYTLNDFSGRSALIEFLVGQGKTPGSEAFGSALVQIRETE